MPVDHVRPFFPKVQDPGSHGNHGGRLVELGLSFELAGDSVEVWEEDEDEVQVILFGLRVASEAW